MSKKRSPAEGGGRADSRGRHHATVGVPLRLEQLEDGHLRVGAGHLQPGLLAHAPPIRWPRLRPSTIIGRGSSDSARIVVTEFAVSVLRWLRLMPATSGSASSVRHWTRQLSTNQRQTAQCSTGSG
jgi:hypothetical protein